MRTHVLWPVALSVVLLPAVALTVLRAGDPERVLAVQYVTFTPAALLLYGVAAVLLLVLALRARGRRRLVAAVGSALVLAPLTLHAAWFAPQVAGARPEVADDAGAVHVLTANLLRGDGETTDVLAAARRSQADLVVLPEATGRTVRALDRLGASEEWPHRAGRAGTDIEGTLVLSRWPVLDQRRVPTELDSWALTLDAPGGPLGVLAVHPIAPYEGAEGWHRDHQRILEAARRDRPDIVIGDFNATVDHRPMRRLADEGWVTATELANEGWRPTWPSNGLFSLGPVPLPLSAEIDHVLVGGDLAVVGTERHDVAGTDHLALSAELRWHRAPDRGPGESAA